MKKIILVFCFYLISSFASVFAAEVVSGEVIENGFGKFKIRDSSGTIRLVYIGRSETSFRPVTWRQTVGDKVKVSYIVRPVKNSQRMVATLVELVKQGANSVMIKSPLNVVITEVGRKNILALPQGFSQNIRFEKQRNTIFSPVGWTPMIGDKVIFHFQIIPARFGGGMVNLLSKVEKR